VIKFVPSGNGEAFYSLGYKHTEEAAGYCKNLVLDCYEYSFGRGVTMSEGKAVEIGEAFANSGKELSVNAP